MVTTEYVFGQSIVNSNGVDTWLYDGAILSHKGDFITLKGMQDLGPNRPGTSGSIIRVTHIYESGNIDKLPEDFMLELRSGDTFKVTNLEGTGDMPQYNIRVQAEGPLYEAGQYRGFQTVDELPEAAPAPAYGPVMTRLMQFPIFARLFSRGQ